MLWNKLFQSDPSSFEDVTCTSPDCIDFQLKRPTLGVNYTILVKNGIQELQNALIDNSTYKTFCRNCNNTTQDCHQKLNSYIYIELDVKLRNEDSSMMFRLRDFPSFLNIKENKKKTTLSVGIISLLYW